MNCEFCNRESKNENSYKQHKARCSKNPGRINFIVPTNKGCKGANGYSKAKREGRIFAISEETKRKIKEAKKDYKPSAETKAKIKESMQRIVKERPESYSWGNISHRISRYESIDSFGNSVQLQGSWEKLVSDCFSQCKIKWLRKIQKGFSYFWNNSNHLYFPDFYLPDYDLYVEVKGKELDRDICKYQALQNLWILRKKEILFLKKGGSILELIPN
jgi:hypothetical protein